MAKLISLIGGVLTEVEGTSVSTGAADANKTVETNSQGTIDVTMLPPGVGRNTAVVIASEALTAGNWVNIYNNAGVANCRRADDTVGREVWGFVLAAVINAANATVYLGSTNDQVSGMTPGAKVYISATPGAGSNTPTVAAPGKIHQVIGKAITATSVAMQLSDPITLVA